MSITTRPLALDDRAAWDPLWQGSSSSVSTNVSSASTLAGRVAAPSRLQPPPRMMTGQPGGKGGPSIYGPF